MLNVFLSRAFTRSLSSPQGSSVALSDDSLAHQLFESADASAGRDPHQAQELRDAALAFLSVVR